VCRADSLSFIDAIIGVVIDRCARSNLGHHAFYAPSVGDHPLDRADKLSENLLRRISSLQVRKI
jgi:hypothetical protein